MELPHWARSHNRSLPLIECHSSSGGKKSYMKLCTVPVNGAISAGKWIYPVGYSRVQLPKWSTHPTHVFSGGLGLAWHASGTGRPTTSPTEGAQELLWSSHGTLGEWILFITLRDSPDLTCHAEAQVDGCLHQPAASSLYLWGWTFELSTAAGPARSVQRPAHEGLSRDALSLPLHCPHACSFEQHDQGWLRLGGNGEIKIDNLLR